MIDDYVMDNQDRCVEFVSLGQVKYLSALQYVDAVVGNSSSGLIEVPSFHIPTVNIGDRQRGRVCAESVINCENSESEIECALSKALSDKFKCKICMIQNPYEKNGTSDNILDILRRSLNNGIDIKKTFYDIK
jgi:GDP/UDP-N,N'-diacetylbacillosamine 2-epimerase (hydrolysing)